MRRYLYSLRTELRLSQAVTDHVFVLRARPRNDRRQEVVNFNEACMPPAHLAHSTDAWGNDVITGSIIAPHHRFSVISIGEVRIDETKRDTTPLQGYLRYASSLTKPGAGITAFYEERKPDAGLSALETADYWMQAVFEHFCYRPGVTSTRTDAETAFGWGNGVCQDYSHTMLALLRMGGIGCRYTAGIMLGEGASHAWVDVFQDGGWTGFDPTNNRPVDERYLSIAVGADFNDCALDRGTFRGQAHQTVSVQATLQET